jgi:hypothetical protein
MTLLNRITIQTNGQQTIENRKRPKSKQNIDPKNRVAFLKCNARALADGAARQIFAQQS